jgi:hypothetical protein
VAIAIALVVAGVVGRLRGIPVLERRRRHCRIGTVPDDEHGRRRRGSDRSPSDADVDAQQRPRRRIDRLVGDREDGGTREDDVELYVAPSAWAELVVRLYQRRARKICGVRVRTDRGESERAPDGAPPT